MKLFKKLIFIVALVAVCLFAYLFLGGIDAEHPALPDFGLPVETVKEDDNWYVALVAATNLVSLSEEEASLVYFAVRGGFREWWRTNGFDTEAQVLSKLDALVSRHGELFNRLGANVNRLGWQHPPREAMEASTVGMPGSEDLSLVDCAAVRLLDLKIRRELDHGEFMFAFGDLQVMASLELAAMRGAENLMACKMAQVQLRRVLDRFLAFVTQLDGEDMLKLQLLLDELSEDFVSAYANAYARSVANVEARFDWLYRRGGVEQMRENLLTALAVASGKLDKEKAVGQIARVAFKMPNFSQFSFHFNRSLARYYEEAVKIHANLLRGKYDLPIRALRTQPPNTMWNLPIYPNWIGRKIHTTLLDQGATMLCLLEAADLFVVLADRVVVAANRYRLATGAYPKDLQALVPEYLEAVPDDPFGDGKLGFNAAQGTVHSVGENGGFDGVIPPGGARALHYTDDRGQRRWYTPYIRRLDGKPIVE